VFVRPEALRAGWDRDRIMSHVNAAGVPCSVGSCSEIYLEKAFTDRGLGPQHRLPVARSLGETSLCFMVHPTLPGEAVQRTIDMVRATLNEAQR